jgi:murein DD-endopeptidase MepM/ murein hydrolase activator NlpD
MMDSPPLRVRIALGIVAGCCSGLFVLAPAGAADPGAPHFRLTGGSAQPHHAYFAGGPVRVRFAFAARRAVDVQVRIVRGASGRVVRGFVLREAVPGRHQLLWAGRTWSGAEAPEGHYLVLAGRRGHNLKRVAGFAFHGHLFPVRGPHGVRGAIGRFGAPRSGGRTHEGFDVLAACGTPLLAARGGRVLRRGHDAVLYGNFVLIHGRGEHRSYFYAHMRRPAPVRRGERVRTGERVGSVGETGNASTVGCHLHFEIRVHGMPVDPEPSLRRWDRFS